MKSRKVRVVSVALALVMLLTLTLAARCARKANEEMPVEPTAITIVDSAGRVVEVPQPLERIAVWDGASAEVIRALGGTDKIVGISNFMATYDSYFWPELKDRPQIGSWWEPDYEKVIDVEPQVLFTVVQYPEGTTAEEKLKPAGIKVIRMDFYKVDITKDIKTIMGLILGKENEAEEFANFFQSKVDLIEQRVKEINPEEKKRVYWEAGHQDYYTWGPGSFATELLDRVGAINIFADLGVSGSEVDAEEILVRDCDVVIKDSHGPEYGGYTATDTRAMEAKRDEMMNRPGWSELKAVRNGQVYIEGKDLLGATAAIHLCYLAKLLYPDRFEDLDVEAFHKEYLEKYQGLEFKGIYLYPCPWAG
jgi:iron complex transport system substrate-binding protein